MTANFDAYPATAVFRWTVRTLGSNTALTSGRNQVLSAHSTGTSVMSLFSVYHLTDCHILLPCNRSTLSKYWAVRMIRMTNSVGSRGDIASGAPWIASVRGDATKTVAVHI